MTIKYFKQDDLSIGGEYKVNEKTRKLSCLSKK